MAAALLPMASDRLWREAYVAWTALSSPAAELRAVGCQLSTQPAHPHASMGHCMVLLHNAGLLRPPLSLQQVRRWLLRHATLDYDMAGEILLRAHLAQAGGERVGESDLSVEASVAMSALQQLCVPDSALQSFVGHVGPALPSDKVSWKVMWSWLHTRKDFRAWIRAFDAQGLDEYVQLQLGNAWEWLAGLHAAVHLTLPAFRTVMATIASTLYPPGPHCACAACARDQRPSTPPKGDALVAKSATVVDEHADYVAAQLLRDRLQPVLDDATCGAALPAVAPLFLDYRMVAGVARYAPALQPLVEHYAQHTAEERSHVGPLLSCRRFVRMCLETGAVSTTDAPTLPLRPAFLIVCPQLTHSVSQLARDETASGQELPAHTRACRVVQAAHRVLCSTEVTFALTMLAQPRTATQPVSDHGLPLPPPPFSWDHAERLLSGVLEAAKLPVLVTTPQLPRDHASAVSELQRVGRELWEASLPSTRARLIGGALPLHVVLEMLRSAGVGTALPAEAAHDIAVHYCVHRSLFGGPVVDSADTMAKVPLRSLLLPLRAAHMNVAGVALLGTRSVPAYGQRWLAVEARGAEEVRVTCCQCVRRRAHCPCRPDACLHPQHVSRHRL